VRGLVQHLWLVFAGLTLAALYNGWSTGVQLAVLAGLAVSFSVGVLGSLLRFAGGRRTLLDRLFKTRALVFIR
jgi:hypothetical protein